jgi:hypothetical protein
MYSLILFGLPVIVAFYDLSTAGAIALVLLALLLRWGITLSGILLPARVPDLELETIAVSHFAEKVRWCMDRLGIDYVEKSSAGIFGVIFTGRTVPRLSIKTGLVQSVIGNSPEILRYLWGRYGIELGEAASFLEPTPERVELESRIDRYGVNLHVWVYYHILDDKALTLRAWGLESSTTPGWQRLLLSPLFPVFRLFIRHALRISEKHYARVVQHIEALLGEVEERLEDGRRSILGGDSTDYVDLSFAAISALWLQPAEFAAGNAGAAQLDRSLYPIQMGVDVERWSDRYPLAKAFIERLYREERISA